MIFSMRLQYPEPSARRTGMVDFPPLGILGTPVDATWTARPITNRSRSDSQGPIGPVEEIEEEKE